MLLLSEGQLPLTALHYLFHSIIFNYYSLSPLDFVSSSISKGLALHSVTYLSNTELSSFSPAFIQESLSSLILKPILSCKSSLQLLFKVLPHNVLVKCPLPLIDCVRPEVAFINTDHHKVFKEKLRKQSCHPFSLLVKERVLVLEVRTLVQAELELEVFS